MNVMDVIRERRKQRLSKLRKTPPKHAWLVEGEDGAYFKNKIYSSYESNSYKEVSFVTDDYIHGMPETMEISYVGLVDEYLGEMTPKPNVIQTLLSKIY